MQMIVSPGIAARRAVGAAQLPPHIETPPLTLEIFTSIPEWAIVHAATDNSNAPLIRRGEIVVVECNGKTGWYPDEGKLYLIEYVSHPQVAHDRERRTRQIVQPYRDHHGKWWVSGLARGHSFVCSDGPYRDECQLADKLLGPVVGIVAIANGRA